MQSDDELLAQRVRLLQILTGALLSGPMIVLAVVVLLVSQGSIKPTQGPDDLPLLTYLAAGLLVVGAGASFVVPRIVARQTLLKAPPPASSDHPLLPVLNAIQASFIFGKALIEGPIFLAIIAYLLEQRPLALGLAGLGLVLQLIGFPTMDWLRQEVEQLRKTTKRD